MLASYYQVNSIFYCFIYSAGRHWSV